MTWFVWTAFAMLLTSTEQVLNRRILSTQVGPWEYLVGYNIGALLAVFVISMMSGLAISQMPSAALLLLVASGILWFFGCYFSFKADQVVEVSATSLIAQVQLILVFAGGIGILRESFSAFRALGALCVILGIAFLGETLRGANRAGLTYKMVSAITLSGALLIDKHLSSVVDPLVIPIFGYLVPALIAVCVRPKRLGASFIAARSLRGANLALGAVGACAYYSLLRAFSLHDVSAVFPIYQGYLIVTMILAHFILHERGKFRTKFAAAVTVVCGAAMLTSCSAHAATAPRKLRLYMDWFPNIEFAGMYAAQEKGWYRDAGIDLEMVYEGLDIIPNVVNGKADIGMDSGHDVIRFADKGAGIKAFATQYQLNPNCIIVRKDLAINSLRELKGRTLGVFAPQDLDMYRVMLGFNGLALTDVKFKDIKTFKESELIEMLKRHEVDGFIAWEFNWTVTFSLLGYPVRVFPGYENGFQFYGSTFFAKSNYISSHKELLRDFLRVTFKGWREVYKNPDRYARLVVEKKYPADQYINGSKDLTFRQQVTELKLRKRYFIEGVGESNMGRMSAATWEKSIEIARSAGFIPATSKMTAKDVYEDSIWSRPASVASIGGAR